MEDDLVIKKGRNQGWHCGIAGKKKEILTFVTFAAKWMEPEIILLSEMNQTQTNTECSLFCVDI